MKKGATDDADVLPKTPKAYVFLSSFTREFGGWLPDGSSDKSSLRYKAFELGKEAGRTVWIAEEFRRDLKPPMEHLEIVDSLWEHVRGCDTFICLLGGDRRGDDEDGTSVVIDEKTTAVSFFEAELVLAALLGKPIEVFEAKGFDPGPRLLALLEMLRFALPTENWHGPLGEAEILRGIRSVLQSAPVARSIIPTWMPSFRRRVGGWLLAKMYAVRGIRSGRLPGQREIFFLDGIYEPRGSNPNKELVESLLGKARDVARTETKLARLWIAIRELMAIQIGDDCPTEFLLLWDRALTNWASGAAWYGLHGYTFLGQLAALYSVADVRKILRKRAALTHLPEQVEHPVSLASGLYSTAKLMPSPHQRRAIFEDGLAHLNQTIQERGGLSANLAQMRGSFFLRLGQTTRAVEDYEEALRRRHIENAADGQIGESMSELGFAYLRQMRLFKGRELLEKGAALMEKEKSASPGFYARGLRKLAIGYASTGRPWKAYESLAESRDIARKGQLFDQLR